MLPLDLSTTSAPLRSRTAADRTASDSPSLQGIVSASPQRSLDTSHLSTMPLGFSTTAERKENTLKDLEDFYLKPKAIIWP